ncbi:uncharacterized protein LOC142972470 [Anticarsia gemmatalis]|uniref:uncharacterized protein LOC142972470 n=1 Tax=Anticarsia gemmatalis TaxID=129554 RepID=UPI003F75A707
MKPYCLIKYTSDIMTRLLYLCLTICVLVGTCHAVSSKMDFGEDQEPVVVEANSTKGEDEDVEVKHTIVVSTRLRNNNRRGLHSSNDGGMGALTYKLDAKARDDSGEVPVVNGYKSVESTLIRTPDTRHKPQAFPDSVIINRNIQDEYDIYPNYVNIPSQWKPSTFYNNINWNNQEVPLNTEYAGFRNTINSRPAYQTPGKFHRRISDDGMKEFYCKKCREMQGFRGCVQQRSNPWSQIHETTTAKMKIDGKLAKLN